MGFFLTRGEKNPIEDLALKTTFCLTGRTLFSFVEIIRFQKLESGYWVRIPEKWWRGALSGLKSTQRCILISLRVWGARRPTISQLAKELRTTRKTIAKNLKILKGKGFIR